MGTERREFGITRACLSQGKWLLAAFCVFGLALSVRCSADTVQVATELSTRNVRTEESKLADVVADALRDAASAQAAFVTASSFDDVTLHKGAASTDAVLKALAYRDDPVLVVKLTGKQIRKALEHGLELYPQRHSAFLQVSGIQATIDGNAPKGERVVSLKIGGSPVSPERAYSVAMPGPLAHGGLAYNTCWDKKAIQADSGDKTVEDAVTSYLAIHRTLGETGEERLVFKK